MAPPNLLGRLFGGAEKSDQSASDTEALAFADLLDNKRARVVFQPLVDVKSRDVFAYEALCRSDVEMFKYPPHLFEVATRVGRVGELGRLLRRLSIEGCTDKPLFLNVNPHELDYGFLVQPDDPIFWHNEAIFLEITESAPLTYFEQCHGILREVRGKGIALAVDDLGAGYSNLKYIADLSPEVVKIDRGLIAGVAKDTRPFKLLRHIVAMSHDMGAKVVIEGIEELPEMEAAIAAGADLLQGYLLARPGFPLPKVTWPT